MIKNIFFIKGILALCTLVSSIITVIARNSVFSIISLIFTFIFASSYLIFTGIKFIAISYIIIYVGAIAILFLFVILMIDIEIKDVYSKANELFNDLLLGVSIFTLLGYIIFKLMPVYFSHLSHLLFSCFSSPHLLMLNFNYIYAEDNLYSFSNIDNMLPIYDIESLAINLYTFQGILLLLLGFILLLAMIASIELSLEKNNKK